MTNTSDLDIKTILRSSAALSATDRVRTLERIYQLEREITEIQRAKRMAEHGLGAVRAMIADDCLALTFQSLGQYRTSIKQAIARETAITKNEMEGNQK